MNDTNDLFAMFGTDKKAEVEGVEFHYGKTVFVARRAGSANKQYTMVMRKVFQQYRRQIMNETLDPDIIVELMMRVYARSVIISWSGVKNKEGEDLPYTEENFIWLMTELPDLWDAIQENCSKLANFKAETNENDATALGN